MASFVAAARYPQPVSLQTGTISVGTTAIQGPDIQVARGYAVVLLADSNNTDTIYVGRDSTVTSSTGWPLTPGDSLQLYVNNINSLWFISNTAGQTLRYIVEVSS